MNRNKPKIILAGGGTMGSVSPLLAIADFYSADYIFIGTKNGPEKAVVQSQGLPYAAITSAKWRRYFSWHNMIDFFKLKWAFWQSIRILNKFKPLLIISAGSFVAVPVAWAAWFKRIPIIVHQQDIKVGLANKLIAPLARKITLTFEDQRANFNSRKVVLTGNPVRRLWPVVSNRPSVLITGGGLGAHGLNNFVSQFIPEILEKYEVHHILGEANWSQRLDRSGYQAYKFVTGGMNELLARADIIISRAGMSLITEAAALQKALILIPIPGSHQEQNAAYLARYNAAYVVRQGSVHVMKRYLSKLMASDRLRRELGENLHELFPKNVERNYSEVINSILANG